MWRHRAGTLIPAALLLGPVLSLEAYSEVYMSEEKAVAVLFPGLTLAKVPVTLSAEQSGKITELSGESVRNNALVLWQAKGGEWVVIDRVIGKHDFITYAVGIEKGGKVKGIEILEYRESYGSQVRGEAWRAQFTGKDVSAPLRVDQDIKNISGATLSSTHVAAGVRRVLRTYDILNPRT